jgi:hypothetical protein
MNRQNRTLMATFVALLSASPAVFAPNSTTVPDGCNEDDSTGTTLMRQTRRKHKVKHHRLVFTALLGLVLSISCFASTGQLLYVQYGQTLDTYSVNPATAAAKKLGSLALQALPAYASQVLHGPRSPYVYVIGFTSATTEFIWVYATSSKGVPFPHPIQTLSVKPALAQFIFQPGGKFAYAVFSWSDSNPTSFGDIVLFTVDPNTGILTNTKKALVNFPPDDYGYWTLYGLSSKGTKLYLKQTYYFSPTTNGIDYYHAVLDRKTGLLGKLIHFWRDDTSNGPASSTFSDLLIAQDVAPYGFSPEIDVYANQVYAKNPSPLIVCNYKMLSACGDSGTAQFDPSGKNLFITDTTINSVEIAAVKAKSLAARDSIPGTPSTLVFSPQGNLVYAIEGQEVLIYVFDPATGLPGAKSSITLPPGFVFIYPAS